MLTSSSPIQHPQGICNSKLGQKVCMLWRTKKQTGTSSRKKKKIHNFNNAGEPKPTCFKSFRTCSSTPSSAKSSRTPSITSSITDLYSLSYIKKNTTKHFQVKMNIKSFKMIAQNLISLHKLQLQTEQHEEISVIN